MKTENVLIYEETEVTQYCIETTDEKYPNVEITEEGKLFIGNKEVENYKEYKDKLIDKLPIRYVIRSKGSQKWMVNGGNESLWHLQGGFDLIKDEDGNLFWYSDASPETYTEYKISTFNMLSDWDKGGSKSFKNIKDAFKYINAKLKTEDWIICLEEPMP